VARREHWRAASRGTSSEECPRTPPHEGPGTQARGKGTLPVAQWGVPLQPRETLLRSWRLSPLKGGPLRPPVQGNPPGWRLVPGWRLAPGWQPGVEPTSTAPCAMNLSSAAHTRAPTSTPAAAVCCVNPPLHLLWGYTPRYGTPPRTGVPACVWVCPWAARLAHAHLPLPPPQLPSPSLALDYPALGLPLSVS